MIAREPDLVVCGQAETAAQALDGINRCQPDLVLMDLSLPGRGGLELTKDLRALHPALLVLVVSMHDESLFAERVLRAGALGYIMKQEGPDKMIAAIRHTLRGEVYVSPKTAGQILSGFGRTRAQAPGTVADLSDRELEVFQMIGRGLDTHAIAAQLNLSPKTVDAHRGNIKAKLDVRSSTELICRAARWVASETQSPTEAG